MTDLSVLRDAIRDDHLADEAAILDRLIKSYGPDHATRTAAKARATRLVTSIRNDVDAGLMEVFLAEYGLSTREGIALMCLAEALLRVPDATTIDALIEDKIAPSAWGEHLGKSSSSLVNASTWALMLTGRVLQDGEGMDRVLRGALRRLGEPVIRTAVARAMREMGRQFVLGQTMPDAMARAAKQEAKGYSYSYDMLGEAAMTMADADAFFASYKTAIAKITPRCNAEDIRSNPGISIKLSALHPRYEVAQKDRVMSELVPRVLELALDARQGGMGLNIDAEEANRLDLSLDVIEAVLADPRLAGWDGFGVVVQGYGLRAGAVIDWLYALATKLDRKIMLRLVKGAYWDTEVKLAQVEGLSGFPVNTRKSATDVAYLCLAKKLLGLTDHIYPQFATHNAHSVAAIVEMAKDPTRFEFQRLHGMGEALHDLVLKGNATRCRIYAPVGAHRDLLAYLVRRLLENGANSSFVNQIMDENTPPEVVAACPFERLERAGPNLAVRHPSALFAPERANSRGFDLSDPVTLAELDAARTPFRTHQWQAGPILAKPATGADDITQTCPADPADIVGRVTEAAAGDIETALTSAQAWDAPAAERRACLERAADLYEAHHAELFALLAREAGKSPADAVAELREAVDFLRYYAAHAPLLQQPARGVFTCISPWNFPLAIFTGQIAAALAAGNGVLAKPAETTTLIGARAVELLHAAGVPRGALQFLPGQGAKVGAALVSDARVAGVCFTGSTATSQGINRAMAAHLHPAAPFIAETGGLNAMIVDSTALPEQAVRDIVASAFQSAGQRCSALRLLYVQEDIAEGLLHMLQGAMEELSLSHPWNISCDVAPVITASAAAEINAYVQQAQTEGRLIKQITPPSTGHYVGPALISLPGGINDLEREVFGPVLHVATYKARDLARVVADVNAKGYGLTFGMHSRIDDRIAEVASQIKVGNLYINRNQIGAIVGSQPFGGEGLSGTGPKAGGPHYLPRFTTPDLAAEGPMGDAPPCYEAEVTRALAALARPSSRPLSQAEMSGATGESNLLSRYARGRVLCLGPTANAAMMQAQMAEEAGCAALAIAPGVGAHGVEGLLPADMLRSLTGFNAVILWADPEEARPYRAALAAREGALIPLICESDPNPRLILERHICIDTTAAGGNARLLAAAGEA
ncbi:bifunctional proline dehydrogenase/L-glutamate gamma-semialdehyde dehydrogenase PutA [Paracoccaceae bacterium]|nr:bifunctional proline dehydrogenase/L-glutamate gamma-semialdehyde dehydrogenase PutA [Paracoccaceae bacterium]